jgi:hypothetical protein
MKKYRLLLSLIIAIAAVLLALRQRTLRQLQVEQAQLQTHVKEATRLHAAIAQARTSPIIEEPASLSPAERSELMRLRGEARQSRLELAQETNRSVKADDKPARTTTAAATAEPIVSNQQYVIKMQLGQQWVQAVRRHADANQGRWPATLAEAAPFAEAAEGADQFEIVRSGGSLPVLSSGPAIVLREKQPWPGYSDRWFRVYAFADGKVECASSPTKDFTEWEQQTGAQTGSTPAQ